MSWQVGLTNYAKRMGEKELNRFATKVKFATAFTTPVDTGVLIKSINITRNGRFSRLIGSVVHYAFKVEMDANWSKKWGYLRRALRRNINRYGR